MDISFNTTGTGVDLTPPVFTTHKHAHTHITRTCAYTHTHRHARARGKMYILFTTFACYHVFFAPCTFVSPIYVNVVLAFCVCVAQVLLIGRHLKLLSGYQICGKQSRPSEATCHCQMSLKHARFDLLSKDSAVKSTPSSSALSTLSIHSRCKKNPAESQFE